MEARGFTATRDDGHIIALARKGDRITMEPGGQLELSGGALSTAADCAAALDAHVREVADVARPLGISFIGTGVRPFGALDDIAWLPKRRYAVMRDYFPRYGRDSGLAHQMMKLTATVQANFDYASEDDAADKIRTAYGVTSIVTALFAASPIAFGRPTGFKSYRAAIWLETDADRCGLLPFVFKPDFRFRDYVEWALDVPMFFVVRDGVYHPADKMTFRRFAAEGWQGQRATIADWEVHLSTLFPEVRLKRYIEVRGADAGPMPMARGLGALWRGILEDPEARRAAYALVADHTFEEREALRREVPRAGLARASAAGRVRELAVELCRDRRGRPRAAAGRRGGRRAARAGCAPTPTRGARRPTTCSTTSTLRAATRGAGPALGTAASLASISRAPLASSGGELVRRSSPSQGSHLPRVERRRALLAEAHRGRVWEPSQGSH